MSSFFKDFQPHRATHQANPPHFLPPEASPALQRRTQHETLNNPELMPRVSLLN
jgi:hypothetical protein